MTLTMYPANSTTVRAFGEWFIVTAHSVEHRRQVEQRCHQLMLQFRPPTTADTHHLQIIEADSWLQVD